jgi:hypothetical protein
MHGSVRAGNGPVATPEPRPGPTRRMRPGYGHPGGFSQAPKTAGRRVAVHPGAAPVEQDRPGITVGDGPVDRPPHRWRQRHQDDLAAFAAHTQHPVTVFLTRSPMSPPVASKIRKPSSPSMATNAKSHRSCDSRAAVSSASNCR